MTQALQPVRGTHDLLPDSYAQHHRIIEAAAEIARLYGYRRMDTPIFEFSEVFHRAVGDTSDIVSKETYTFTDRGGESITLRPEFTAAIVRAFISNKLTQELPFKCFYAGPAFRYERPQKGRLRQFHQIGAELLGAAEPAADVEMIALAYHTLRGLGLADSVTLELNSLGDPDSRLAYRAALVNYLTQHEAKLSEDSKVRLAKNPLRILDSKDASDKAIIVNAPLLHEHFNDGSRTHFSRIKDGLAALSVPFKESATLVRGLDYYSHTVFEFTTDKLGAQGTVLAGGRYDGLVSLMGGPNIPGIGFAAGVERLASLMGDSATEKRLLVAVMPMQESAELEAFSISQQLREAGIAVDIAYKGNAKKRFERANKIAASHAVIIGEDELNAGTATLKDLTTGTQETIPRAQLTEKLNVLR